MTEFTNSYTLHELLGSGGFSTVRRATHNATNRLIALKLTERNPDKVSSDYLANFNSEVAALDLLSHSHIVKKIAEDENWVHKNEDGTVHSYLCIALELCPNGVLHDVVLRSKGLPEDLGRTYFRQLMKAIKYCHDIGVVHRDLKPENLLLDEHFDLKIADFGSAKVRNLPSAHTFGTQKFWPPEVRPGQDAWDPKIDVYDCGLILYFMIFSELTLCSAFQYKRYLSDKAGFWSRRARSTFSASLLDLLNAMLEPDPQVRISVANVLTHPWTTGSTLGSEDLQADMNSRMNLT